MSDSERTEVRAVSMYPGDWAIIEEADTGTAGVSATLRRIVRDWRKWSELFRPRHTLTDERAPYHVEHFDGIHEEPA